MSEFGPKEIHLGRPSKSRGQGDEMTERRAVLTGLGFAELGIYGVREMPGLIVVALAHQSEPLVACVYDHPLAGVWSDVVATYQDGGSLTVTNALAAGQLEPPPWAERVVLRGKSEKALFAAACKRLRPARALVVNQKTFPGIFETAYRREMQWRDGRGFTQDEVQRVAKASIERYDEDTIRRTVNRLNQDFVLPCADHKACPFATDERLVKSLPRVVRKDARRCPKTGRLCPEFADVNDIPDKLIPSPAEIEIPALALARNEIFPIDVTAETGDMRQAIARARATLGQFKERLMSPRKGERDFLVRVRVSRKGRISYLWVAQPKLTGRRGSGNMVHAAPWLGFKKGERLTFSHPQITDWAYRQGKLWRGHHIQASLLRRMEQAAKKSEARIEAMHRRVQQMLGKARAKPRAQS